jgi:hypothetical protein
MYIKYYDNVGELGSVALTSNVLTTINLPNGEFVSIGTDYRPFFNYVQPGDLFYVKASQTSAFTICLGKYNIDGFNNRSIEVLHIISSYGTLNPSVNTEITIENSNSLSNRIASNAVFLKNINNFVPELLTSDYVISLSGNMNVTLPPATINNINLKYGFLLANKNNTTDNLVISASGSNNILTKSGTSNSVSVTGVGSYVELIAGSGGTWYKLFSNEEMSGGGSSLGMPVKSLQYNNNNSQAGAKAYWDDTFKTLYFGETNNVTNADVVISATQNKTSGIYPFLLKLNNGNYFALTKEGKVGINTPSLPLYESSPNFHVVGRCAVFEGICGAGGVALTLYNNPEVVPQSGSLAGTVNLSARNSNRNVVNFAQVQSKILNPIKGQTQGQFLVNVDVSGVPKNLLKLDNSNVVLGSNEVDSSANSIVLGKNNNTDNLKNSAIVGNDNSIANANNVFVLGSGNSIDFIKNSVKFVLSEPNVGSFSGLDWADLDGMVSGDIVEVTNNGLNNGYYIASDSIWTPLDNSTAIAYLGTSNLLVGTDNTLSGNNLVVFGNNTNVSGNNLSVFGSFNNIRTQNIQNIILPNNTLFNNVTVIGEYNDIASSGLIILGNQNSASGVNGMLLVGSENISTSGSINSIIIGDNNNLITISGISIGNNNSGTLISSSLFGINNSIALSNSYLLGNNNRATGVLNNIIGSSNSIVLSSGNIVGTNNVAQGNSINALGNNINISGANNISVGSNVRATGNNNILIGNNNTNIDLINNTTILSNNFNHSGSISSSFILSNNVSISSGVYTDLNILGTNNTVNSGIANVLILGDNNNLNNVFDLTWPSLAFVSNNPGTQFTRINSTLQELEYYKNNDIIDISGETQSASGIIKLVYFNQDTSTLTIETVSAIPGISTANIKSRTQQEKLIEFGSKPIQIIGNKNTAIGISGINLGSSNYSSGNRIFIHGNDNEVFGNDIISIGNGIYVSGAINAISIGENKGNLTNSVAIGFNNSIYGNDTIAIGNSNKSININDVIGKDNIAAQSNISVLGSGNQITYRSQRQTALPVSYDLYNRPNIPTRLDTSHIIASGYYSAESQDFFTTNIIRFSILDRAIIQFYHDEKYIGSYTGLVTNSPPSAGSTSTSVSFDRRSQSASASDLDANPITLYEYITSIFPDVTPSRITGFLSFVSNDSDGSVIGNENTIVGTSKISVVGSNNQFNVDSYNTQTTSSGLIVGDNNKVFNELAMTASSIQNKYINANPVFQGAVGFNIRNADPNSIKFGFDTNTIKIFDLSGRSDTKITSVIDPNISPPQTETFYAEQIGISGYARRGIVFNADNIQNNFYVLNNSSTKDPVLTVVSSGTGFVGINNPTPSVDLDIKGTFVADTGTTKYFRSTNITMSSGAKQGYFLSSVNNAGDMEWVGGVKIDVSGIPGTLLYFSGIAGAGGKVEPISTQITQPNGNFLLNFVTYEPSGSTISKSGLVFDQYYNIDKYAIMTLDEHRRAVLGYPIEETRDLTTVNPGKIDYIQRLKDLAKANNKTDEAHYIPRQYNAIYFIPESAQYLGSIDPAQIADNYKLSLTKAGQAKESVFAIGRRKIDYSQPTNLDRGEDVDANNPFFPGGLSAPQVIISTIPKKDQFGSNSWRAPRYKYNLEELYSPHLAPYYDDFNGPGIGDKYDIIKPMTGDNLTGKDYQSWWYYDTTRTSEDAGSRPKFNTVGLTYRVYATQKRSVATAFNLGLEEIDFVIYGTGTKHRNSAGIPDKPSKFIFGGDQEYMDWVSTGLGSDIADRPFLTKVPAFYFNSSISSFMIHTDRPSWIPFKLPADVCEPCDPIQSGIQFADLTVRGWIGTSGIRIGQGFRRALAPDADGNLVPAIDAQGGPIYESTAGMFLTSDKFGFAVWEPLGGVSSTNDTLTSNTTPTSSQILTEGVLDRISNATIEFAYETDNTNDTARLYRDNLSVRDENLLSNAALKLRGVTRNSLLFAKNPRPNAYDNYNGTFNESSVPTSSNDMNIDGTENLFYYGYTNALEGVLTYNTSSNTTEIVVDGDATRRIQNGDIVRLLYRYLDTTGTTEQTVSSIIRAKVIGINIQSSQKVNLTADDIGGPRSFFNRTHIILDKKVDNVVSETYNLDRNSAFRRAAIISETVGGYLTFNFPGSSPDIVLSNRPNIDTEFNLNGKKIGFSVYGDQSSPKINLDKITNTVLLNTDKAKSYGKVTKVTSPLTAEDERNIDSDLYYDYGWNDDYIIGQISTVSNKTVISTSVTLTDKINIGDILEVVYDTYQKINMYVLSIDGQKVSLSISMLSYGLIDDVIGNLARDNSGNIINNNVKFKIVKRQLPKVTVANKVIGSGLIPVYADVGVNGILHTEMAIIENLPQFSGVNRIPYSNFGLLTPSNLGFVDYKDISTNKTSSYLVNNTILPDIIDTKIANINGQNKKLPILADTTLAGNVKINNLHVDNFNHFNTIDCGIVVFRGKCDKLKVVCDD